MRPVPDVLSTRPFTRAEALALGVTSRMLDGARFARVFECVWRTSDLELTDEHLLAAARLALPDHACLTGITRIQQLGLDFGPRRPLHFVVHGDLHLVLPGVFLHRTVLLAPSADGSVCVAAAYLSYCATARLIDAIKVGDWLLAHRHTTIDDIQDLALSAPWRDGAPEAYWTCDFLDTRSASLKESETRSVLEFAGLRPLGVNAVVPGLPVEVFSDLVYDDPLGVVEYEGEQHQRDRSQYTGDIDRYALFRRYDVPYVQATKEKLGSARSLVREVHRMLVDAGYEGPAPEFGLRWRQLFGTARAACPLTRRDLQRLARQRAA